MIAVLIVCMHREDYLRQKTIRFKIQSVQEIRRGISRLKLRLPIGTFRLALCVTGLVKDFPVGLDLLLETIESRISSCGGVMFH